MNRRTAKGVFMFFLLEFVTLKTNNIWQKKMSVIRLKDSRHVLQKIFQILIFSDNREKTLFVKIQIWKPYKTHLSDYLLRIREDEE